MRLAASMMASRTKGAPFAFVRDQINRARRIRDFGRLIAFRPRLAPLNDDFLANSAFAPRIYNHSFGREMWVKL